MILSGDIYVAYRYGMGLLALLGISAYGLFAVAKGARGESLFVGSIELRSSVAASIGLLLQCPLIGYLVLGYLTGALAMLWRTIGVGG